MSDVARQPIIRPERTAAELRGKLSSLDFELNSWRDATCGDDAPLRRHHTQVYAIADALEQAAADLAKGLRGAEEGLWILDQARLIDLQILDLHRLWGFFRNKLALRLVPWLEGPLVTADDLAWACYEPMQRYIPADRRREPPLVYFTGGASPFLMPRGTPYIVEALPDGGMREPEFNEAVRSIPVALIGLPWFQANHLPDAPLIAHEVGHAVDQDLGLATRLRELIEKAVPTGHRAAWGAWSGEVFADIYGVLGCGSGFGRALTALIAGHPRDVAGEERDQSDWGTYPTKTLRVLLCAAALKKLGVESADPPLADAWRDAYLTRPLEEYEEDVDAVVAAVLDGPYEALGGEGLVAVLPYTQEDEGKASRIAGDLDKGLEPEAGGIRHLLAAARLSYDRNPARYAENADAIVLAQIAAISSHGMRAVRGDEAPPESFRARRDEALPESLRARRDESAGHALSTLIARAAARTEGEVADVPTRRE
jgi:hypothetical protein